MLLRTAMVENIGGFDPRFFLYFEESDLIRRARQAGWEVWTVGEAVASHVNAASARKVPDSHMMWGTLSEHYFASRYYFLTKHFGMPLAFLAELGEFVAMLLRAILEAARGRKYATLPSRLSAPFFRLPDPAREINEQSNT